MDEEEFKILVEAVQRTYVDNKPDWHRDPTGAILHAYYNVHESNSSQRSSEAVKEFVLKRMIEISCRQKYVWDALKVIAERHLRDRVPFNNAFADWLADFVAGRKKRPQLGAETVMRSFFICQAIATLLRFSYLRPTRNRGRADSCCAKGGSACDVVGKAFGISQYKSVENIWLQYKDSHP